MADAPAAVIHTSVVTRRRFLRLAAWSMAGGAVAASGAAGWARAVEPGLLSIERVRVPIAGLPGAFDGFRFGVLSDLHLHPFTTLEHVRRAVDAVNDVAPDAVVLVGDFVLSHAEAAFELGPELARLQAPAGVHAVLGNHDYWTNPAVVERALTRIGVNVLVNAHAALTRGRANLYLAGVDDAWSGQPDLAATLRGVPADAPAILLAHEPDPVDEYSLDGRVALQISGHSHGGQVRLPLIGALQLPLYGRKYDMGLRRVGGAQVYTTRGVGVIGPPVRFNCPPEVTEITLAAG